MGNTLFGRGGARLREEVVGSYTGLDRALSWLLISRQPSEAKGHSDPARFQVTAPGSLTMIQIFGDPCLFSSSYCCCPSHGPLLLPTAFTLPTPVHSPRGSHPSSQSRTLTLCPSAPQDATAGPVLPGVQPGVVLTVAACTAHWSVLALGPRPASDLFLLWHISSSLWFPSAP